jgi:beta-xylosidase
MAVGWLERLGVKYLRSGISWADRFRPDAEAWFDRQMQALEPFTTTLTLCFTPEHLGLTPHHASPPRRPGDFAEFAAWAVRKYAQARKTGEVLIGAESV